MNAHFSQVTTTAIAASAGASERTTRRILRQEFPDKRPGAWMLFNAECKEELAALVRSRIQRRRFNKFNSTLNAEFAQL